MKLVEFHIRDPATCAPCHGDPITGRAVGIAGVLVNLTRAAGRKDDVRSLDDLNVARFSVVAVCPQSSCRVRLWRISRDHVDRDSLGQNADVGVTGHAIYERRCDSSTCRICNVQNPPVRVAAFPSQMRAIVLLVEFEAETLNMIDSLASSINNMADNFFVAQTSACRDGVADVGFNTVGGLRHGGYSALCAIG